MTEPNKTSRLGKAARDFNVSSDRIVDYLKSQGYKIVNEPNTKLDPEMMNIIQKKFGADQEVKAQAIPKTIDFAKENPTTPLTVEKEPIQRDDSDDNEEIGLSVKTNTITPPPPVEIIKPKFEGLKVLGKMDLNPPAKVISEKPIEKIPEVKPIEKVEEKKIEVIPEKEPEIIKIDPPKIEEIKTEPIQTPTPVVEVPQKPEIYHIPTNIPVLNQPTVLGTINLADINSKTKPKKKTKDELEREKKGRKEVEQKIANQRRKDIQDAKEKESPTQPIVNKVNTQPQAPKIYRPEHTRIDGPKVKGKIDLPPTKEGNTSTTPSSQSEESRHKKKRKRIKPQSGTNTNTTQGQGQGQSAEGQNRTPNKNFKPTKFNKDVKKPEISNVEIEKQIKETLSRLGPSGKSKASKHRRDKRHQFSQKNIENQEQLDQENRIIKVAEFLTANELSSMMNVSVNEIISTCMSIGVFVSINQRLDAETITLLASEFGYEVKFISAADEEEAAADEEKDPIEDLRDRSPIVTVMGHVDHGKTSLLDYIRKTNVIAGEAGGITQHVGAYEVKLENGKSITFLDTPGHEAFTAMRARGAKVTDIAIIVVAADDSIMPQTVEAINHAQAAGVPMIFAINKIDKPNAQPEKIREGLAQMNLLVEEWGGKYQSQEISAKKGINVELLLEKVLIEAELLELKANPSRLALGTVIESSLDKGRGYVAKILVQNGTLNIGDIVVAGTTMGRVKAMYNERNVAVKTAGPSVPVLLLGLNSAPQAGDTFKVYKEEHEAKTISNKRTQLYREQSLRTQKHITLDEIGRRIAIGDFKELNIIVKGDVDGSVEALSDSLLKLSNEHIQLNVIHKSVGAVSESDVLLASASNAIIVAFQVRPTPQARKLAEAEEIDIRHYSIIYTAINEIKDALEGMLSPEIQEKIVANIEVREIFKITKVGTIAGCLVLDGKIKRDTKIRIIRDGIVVYTGRLGSLKRYKDEVKEVIVGMECGLNIDNFNDIKVGDIVEGYDEIEVKRTLK